MGLDMYAYTLRKDLAPEQAVDVSLQSLVLRHLGGAEFTDQLEELEELSYNDPRRVEWRNKQHELLKKAADEGLLNQEFAYWRKFNHLHGWMETLYYKKSGQNDSFNLSTVRLDKEDLEQLLQEASGLVPTKGFFFGSYEPMEPSDVAEVARFVAKALQAIEDGFVVYYDSWW